LQKPDSLDAAYERKAMDDGFKLDPVFSCNKEEPKPNSTIESKSVWPLVIKDMQERNNIGIAKYGKPLQTNNGRKALIDAYQEVLDLAVYLRQEIEERFRK
jgi:hypothetical protein